MSKFCRDRHNATAKLVAPWRVMKRASEYRRRAAQRREIAGRMNLDEGGEHLLAMAEVWERIAQARARGRHGPDAFLRPPPENLRGPWLWRGDQL